jgi:hypothetical protein
MTDQKAPRCTCPHPHQTVLSQWGVDRPGGSHDAACFAQRAGLRRTFLFDDSPVTNRVHFRRVESALRQVRWV